MKSLFRSPRKGVPALPWSVASCAALPPGPGVLPGRAGESRYLPRWLTIRSQAIHVGGKKMFRVTGKLTGPGRTSGCLPGDLPRRGIPGRRCIAGCCRVGKARMERSAPDAGTSVTPFFRNLYVSYLILTFVTHSLILMHNRKCLWAT